MSADGDASWPVGPQACATPCMWRLKMVKLYNAPPTTSYDPEKDGFKLATPSELKSRLKNMRDWSRSVKRKTAFLSWSETWDEGAQREWLNSCGEYLPEGPWLWMYFKKEMKWMDALVALGVTRKLYFASTKEWIKKYAEDIEARRATAISSKSIGNKRGECVRDPIDEAEVLLMASSGLSVWQLHKFTGYSERAIQNNLKKLGLSAGKSVFRLSKNVTYEDFLALERLTPGLSKLLLGAESDTEMFFQRAYRMWIDLSYLTSKLRTVLKSYVRAYSDKKPPYFTLRKCEAENAVARELLERGIPHARCVKLTDGESAYKMADIIVDNKVVIEVDGSFHRASAAMEKDKQQTALFKKLGFQVLRVTDHMAVKYTKDVVDRALLLTDTKG